MLPKTSTFKSLSYYKTPLNIPRFGRKYFSYSRHVGISVRVAGVHLPSNVCLKVSHFVSSSVIHLFLLPSTQINCNRRAGKALEHTEVLVWYLVTKESKTAACYLVFQQIRQTWFRSQTIFDHKIEIARKICIFRCKTHLSVQGKNSNSCKKLPRKQNNCRSRQQVRRVRQCLEQTLPSAAFSRVLCGRYTTASSVPVTSTPGLGAAGKNQPNYIQTKAPFVFN